MPQVLDIEQAVLLLEIEPPFDKRDIQLARRRMAKRWHPDIAPPGKQLEHERHLKAVNEAADQLEQLAEESRGGKVTKNAVKVSAAAARKRRAEEGARAYAEEQRQRAQDADQRQARPVRLARARPLGRAPLRALPLLSRVGRRAASTASTSPAAATTSSSGRACRSSSASARCRPARCSSSTSGKPDPGAERVERFMTAAKHALAEGDFALAARRLIFARDAEPRQPAGAAADDARVLAGGRLLRRRARRARLDPRRARAARAVPLRRAHLRGHGRALAGASTPPSARSTRAPADATAWERLGRLRLRRSTAQGAREALERARELAPSEQGLLDLALVANLAGDVGAEVDGLRAGDRGSSPESAAAWARFAHALARTDRVADCLEACERALALADDPEVRDLRAHVVARPRASSRRNRPPPSPRTRRAGAPGSAAPRRVASSSARGRRRPPRRRRPSRRSRSARAAWSRW